MYNLNESEQENLYKAIFYCNISELKSLCKNLNIQPYGEKLDFIKNIFQFVTTGASNPVPVMPTASKAKKYCHYPLAPDILIVHGAFKNDLQTRIFLKSLIGKHFHYTAFGIDWIKAHWLAGTPPTYQEFATYWQKEFSNRQITKAPMKDEWAYLKFVDRYKKSCPQASQSDAIKAWKKHREEQVAIVRKILYKTHF